MKEGMKDESGRMKEGMKDEGRRMNDNSCFIPHPSSFILYISSLILQ